MLTRSRSFDLIAINISFLHRIIFFILKRALVIAYFYHTGSDLIGLSVERRNSFQGFGSWQLMDGPV